MSFLALFATPFLKEGTPPCHAICCPAKVAAGAICVVTFSVGFTGLAATDGT